MNNTLTPTEYASQRILTTQQLAESYGTETRRISENFNQNKDRYIEGRHYYNLEGEDLKAFRDLYGNSVVVDRTPKLYLWTEKGALLQAKSLNTDKAWEVYGELVENYFDKLPKTNKTYLPTKDKILRQNINIADMLIKIGVKPGIAYATAMDVSEKESGYKYDAYKNLLPAAEHETGLLTPTLIGEKLGMSAVKVNKRLEDLKLQYKKDGKWRLTDNGKKYGEEFPFTRNGHSDYQIRWNESIIDYLKNEKEKTA